jgi:hypothetical protein
MNVDSALDRLVAALAAAGMPPPRAPESMVPLDELERAIAPLRLPDDLRRFWQRVDPLTMGFRTWPEIGRPEDALVAWRMEHDEFPGQNPGALVQIAYTSQSCMCVELDVGDIGGGALFASYIPDGEYERRFNGLGAWLADIAGHVEGGRFVRCEYPGQLYLAVPDQETEELEEAQRTPPAPHPVHGDVVHIGSDILDWPEHWQRATGLDAADLELRGATHTIAELLSLPSAQRTRATIVGRVVHLLGSGATIRVRVDDGSAAIEVVCPAATTMLGPSIDDWFEFDVVVEPDGPGDLDAVVSDIEDPFDRALAALIAGYDAPAGATARAVRRASPPHD